MASIKIRPIMTQVAVLRCARTHALLIVGNTHLFWNPAYHVVSLLHIHAMCCKIHRLRGELEKGGAHQGGPETVSVVICGDMNAMEDSLVHAYLTAGVIPKVNIPPS